MGARARRTTDSCASRATACTRSPSGRCTPASSSPGTSASRSSAKRCCGWRSAWAIRTRASKSASRRCRSRTGTRSPAASPATAPSRTRGRMRRRWKRSPAIGVPPRAAWLRALALERERLANHLGDLGYLGNDCGFAFGLAQFSRLKEDVLRTNAAAFGHRMMMDRVVPGGVACDLAAAHAAVDARRVHAPRARDRHRCATSTTSTRACRIASARAGSSRRSSPRSSVSPASRAARAAPHATCAAISRSPPYDVLDVRIATQTTGDVAARVAVRFDEAQESLRLIRVIVDCHARRRRARSACPSRRHSRSGWATWKDGADRCFVALESGPGRIDSPLPSARSFVVELAGARARGDRQHRSRLPADQQVVQPVVQRARSLTEPRPCCTS